MVLQQDPVDTLKGALECRNLLHDVWAVLLLFDHPDHPIEVATNGLEPVER